ATGLFRHHRQRRHLRQWRGALCHGDPAIGLLPGHERLFRAGPHGAHAWSSSRERLENRHVSTELPVNALIRRLGPAAESLREGRLRLAGSVLRMALTFALLAAIQAFRVTPPVVEPLGAASTLV